MSRRQYETGREEIVSTVCRPDHTSIAEKRKDKDKWTGFGSALRLTAYFVLPTIYYCSPVHHEAAVDVDRLAGNVSALAGSEEHGHRGDILGLLPAIQGDQFLDLVGGPFRIG